MTIRALVVEDEREMQDLIRGALSARDHHCSLARNLEEAKALLREHDFNFDYAIFDVRFPAGEDEKDPPDEEMCRILIQIVAARKTKQQLPIIVHTALGSDHALAMDLIREGAFDYVKKSPKKDLGRDSENQRESLPLAIDRALKERQKARRVAPASPRTGESEYRIHLGERIGRNYRVRIDEEPHDLSALHAAMLVVMARACVSPGSGWVDGSAFPTKAFMTAFSRLKSLLEELGLEGLVESTGDGAYRLTCRPENVFVDPSLPADVRGMTRKKAGAATSPRAADRRK